jgi:hypothetical protein
MTSAAARAEVIDSTDPQSVGPPFEIAINGIDQDRSTAHLSWLQAPAAAGVHASMHDVATAVVVVGIAIGIRIVVGVVVVIVIGVEATAESKAASEVAIMESTTMELAAADATIAESASDAAGPKTASVKTARANAAATQGTKAATTSTTGVPATKTAAAKTTGVPAAETATATATTKAAASSAMATPTATAATTAATCQRHRRRSQANGRNCQQCDNRLAQHNHFLREIPLPTATLSGGGHRVGEKPPATPSRLLNSPRAIKFEFTKRVVGAASPSGRSVANVTRYAFYQQGNVVQNKNEFELTGEAMRLQKNFFATSWSQYAVAVL